MEYLKGDFTQRDYDKLTHELWYLEMKEQLGGATEDDRKRIKEIKEKLDKVLGGFHERK